MPTEYPPDYPKRVVTVRKRSSTWRPIIAVSQHHVLIERGKLAGEVFPAASLPAMIETQPSSIIVVQGFGRHLQRIIQVHGSDPRFNYRVTPRYRDNRNQPSVRAHDSVCNFVGFTGIDKEQPALYHYPLDPVHFVRQSVDDLFGENITGNRVERLLLWAQEVRDWCHQQRIQVKPSSGGLVAQLLRDPRFYPEPRRKVPRLINDTARSQLPGNYYRLRTAPKKRYRAVYLDLTSAHHNICAVTQFPDANTLRAYGRWSANPGGTGGETEQARRGNRPFARGDSPLLLQPGLFHLQLEIPHLASHRFPPPWAEQVGTHSRWIYSNEMDVLTELGVRVRGIISALVSDETEPGINKYAKWALQQLRDNPRYKPWLKPTLHSTYGVLAARPTPFETGFYRTSSTKPNRGEYPMDAVSIPVVRHTTSRAVESRLANVIHRGMIEAGVRKEVLSCCRFLTETDRHDILAIYADSIFIRDKGADGGGYVGYKDNGNGGWTPGEWRSMDMRMLPPFWRISEYLSGLRFHDATHFTSNELTRLPGLARNQSDDRRAARLLAREKLAREAHGSKNPGIIRE